MTKFRVVITPEAHLDLDGIKADISKFLSSRARGREYGKRVRTYCRTFADTPIKGIARDDVGAGVRVIKAKNTEVEVAFYPDEAMKTVYVLGFKLGPGTNTPMSSGNEEE